MEKGAHVAFTACRCAWGARSMAHSMIDVASPHASPARERFRLGSCVIDLATYTAGDETLTEQEAALLRVLWEADGKPISQAALYREVWGYRAEPQGRALYYAVRRLRTKVGDDTQDPRFLVTVRGVGFRLDGVTPIAAKTSAVPEHPPTPVLVPTSTAVHRADPLREMRPADAFVGRQEELAELAGVVADGARVINLIGPGGVGKTRLAVEFLSQSSRRVCAVELGDLAPGGDPTAVLGDAFGLSDSPPTMRQIGRVAAFRSVDTLLLDRCEHLIDALAPLLEQLLVETDLVLIATSRHRLSVSGEVLFDVPPLPLHEAAQLLVSRARALRRSMRIRPTDPVVQRIVGRVDGLPLAIELTAGRLRASSPQQVERRLGENLTALDGSGRGSLHATLAWSWNLLAAEHRQALAALHQLGSVIRPEHAEHILAPMGSPYALLEGLVDRSWLQPSADEPFRYRLLAPTMEWLRTQSPALHPEVVETLIEHGAQIVRRTGFSEIRPGAVHRIASLAVARRHALSEELVVAAAVASNSETELQQAIAMVDQLHEARGEVSATVELGLGWAMFRFGHHLQVERRQAARLDGLPLTPLQRVERGWALARIAKDLGRLDEATQRATQAFEAARALGSVSLQASISSLLVEILIHDGALSAALEAGRRTLALSEQFGSGEADADRARNLAVSTAGRLAPLYLMNGDVITARRAMERLLAWYRSKGAMVQVFQTLSNLALLEVMVGNSDASAVRIDEALALEPLPIGNFARVQSWVVRSKIHASRGDLVAARAAAISGVELAAANNPKSHLIALLELGWVDLLDGRLSSRAAQDCLEQCREGKFRLLGCQAAGMCAWYAARRREPAPVIRALAEEAEALASFEGVADEQIVALAGAAVGYTAAGDQEAAARAIENATEKTAALAHLSIMAGVVPLARADMRRLQ